MSIHPLPSSTIRQLGASVTISCPYDLVKELLDNAIDASATAVDVTITSDTLSSLSVRDNGHGIAPSDFDSLGRRAHTSKLRSLHELRDKAGKTLGFRGEALAGVNAVARVVLVTRVAGEPVASRLELRSPEGGVQSCGPASAPVGTTVHVARLFDCMPARRQHLLREKGRAVSAIKRLLQSYALARPCLKLSLKVVDDGSQVWRYSPNFSPTIYEAVLQLFGRDTTAICARVVFPNSIQANGCKNSGYVLDAFVPKPGCDVKAIRGGGLFVSVDSRPLSPTTGLSKKIVSTLKTHLSKHLGAEPGKGVFLRLDIRCPPHSYDPNVTPLKDDVLFADEDAPLNCFEDLCRQLYGGGTASDGVASTDISSLQAGPHQDGGLAQKPDQPSSTGAGERPIKMRTLGRVDMARSDSNATDDSDLIELTGIEIPARPAKPATPTDGPLPARKPGGIQQYFRPSEDQREFQIACDDTATPEESASSADAQSGPRLEPESRQPLQPLDDSALNLLREEAELWSLSSSSADEQEALTPAIPPQASGPPPLDRSTVEDGRGDERRGRLIPSPSSVSYVGNVTPVHGPPRGRLSDGLVPFLTPPSSVTIRGEGSSALGRPLTGRRGRGSRGQPRARGGFAQVTARPVIGSSVYSSINGSTAGSPGIAEAVGSGADRRLPIRSGGRGQAGAASHGADLSLGKPQHVNRPYSHTTQALLMRTPSPEVEVESQTPCQRVSLWDDGWDVGGSETGPGQSLRRREQSSPERRLSKRASSRSSKARSRRGSSRSRRLSERSASWKRLATAEDAKMQATARTLHVSCDDVQRHMEHIAKVDPYVDLGHMAAAFPLGDVADERAIDYRLQAAIEAWTGERDTAMVVELKQRRRG
ncbi:hypothetical protein CDD80_2390 [Ophiocordyceps camponoti-rufipedis]|uniref:DNA mismatch repair protein S5 domain-containing protein n=1 Tax=Ophiocordyceps camponoti-rufipedis TaxID=2004952 RepID=A0A2C5Z5Y1_9HYPO|nr:hypothetical protein CDD80_2390 [Ophiocordyceps camponoti-rufipedis]